MKMLKSFFAALALAASLGSAEATNLPLITTPLEAGQANANANAVIGEVNTYAAGALGANVNASFTSGTTQNLLYQVTVQPPLMIPVGHALRVHAWGVNSADANVKAVNVVFAGFSASLTVTGSGNTWEVDCTIIETAANVQTGECHGITGSTLIGPVSATGGGGTAVAQNFNFNATASTAGTVTLTGATVEVVQ